MNSLALCDLLIKKYIINGKDFFKTLKLDIKKNMVNCKQKEPLDSIRSE